MPALEEMTVEDLLRARPRAMGVFIRRRMLCPGCPTEAFHTVAEVARAYDCPLAALLAELREAMAAGQDD